MLDKASIRVKSNVLQIIKGSMALMKGDMSNGLYILQDTTILVVIITINQSQDKILLWNIKLRHMSENGLKELEENGSFR